jgi:hypothetical protein
VTSVSHEKLTHVRHPLNCEDARRWLDDRVNRALNTEWYQKLLNGLAEAFTGQKPPAQVTAEFRAAMIRRTMLEASGVRGGETLLLKLALPHGGEAEHATRSRPVEDRGGGRVINDAVSYFVEFTGNLKQAGENSYTTKQKIYMAVLYGPYLYGITLMIVLGLFPVAGLMALLPGRWRTLVNYGKVLLSIKLWPVCWAIFSRFTVRAPSLDGFGDNLNTGDFVVVVVSMYLLTPLLCFTMVTLATSVSALPFQQGIPAPAGSALQDAIMAGRAVVPRR